MDSVYSTACSSIPEGTTVMKPIVCPADVFSSCVTLCCANPPDAGLLSGRFSLLLYLSFFLVRYFRNFALFFFFSFFFSLSFYSPRRNFVLFYYIVLVFTVFCSYCSRKAFSLISARVTVYLCVCSFVCSFVCWCSFLFFDVLFFFSFHQRGGESVGEELAVLKITRGDLWRWQQ